MPILKKIPSSPLLLCFILILVFGAVSCNDNNYTPKPRGYFRIALPDKQYRLLFVFCQCPEVIMKKRMERRLKNPWAISDGRWEIYLQQKKRFEMPAELSPEQLLKLDTDKPLPLLLCLLEENQRMEV